MSESDKNAVDILAVKAAHVFPIDRWSGYRPLDDANAQALLHIIDSRGTYLTRGPLENDPTFKQIIPQLLWVCNGKIFIHRIPVTGSESRLHNMTPIFLGGHIERGDKDIDAATWREFFEEAGIDPKYREQFTSRFVGLVNDESNEVSSVHLGLVHIVEGPDLRDESRTDDGVAEGRFLSKAEIDPLISHMTYWSRLAWPGVRELV